MTLASDLALHANKHVVVTLKGELDLADRNEITELLDTALEVASDVLLDLTDVTFMDSTVLGVMVACCAKARIRGGGLGLVAAPERVRRLLEITSLDKVLPQYASVDEAERALAD